MSQTIIAYRQQLLDQLRQEEASEDTEQMIDWLEDAWATFDMLKARFGETRASQLYIADAPLATEQQAAMVISPCFPMPDERQQGACYVDAT